MKPPVEENPPRLCELIVSGSRRDGPGAEDKPAGPLALHKRKWVRPTCKPPEARKRHGYYVNHPGMGNFANQLWESSPIHIKCQ